VIKKSFSVTPLLVSSAGKGRKSQLEKGKKTSLPCKKKKRKTKVFRRENVGLRKKFLKVDGEYFGESGGAHPKGGRGKQVLPKRRKHEKKKSGREEKEKPCALNLEG